MDQNNIIRDLLYWIDTHLDQPLFLDNVAAKAGYSKWHLQRMFKNITQQAIGSYIRARRLSRAAVALRLTSRPILDIALQYRFDSQQTFTRAFKKQFGITPALYRRSEDWCATGMQPPITLEKQKLPNVSFVTLPPKHLMGIEQTCSYILEEWSTACAEMRKHFWQYYQDKAKNIPNEVYGLHSVVHSSEKDDEQTVLYITAVEPQYDDNKNNLYHSIIIEGGDYARFTFEGKPTKSDLQQFLYMIYGVYMPNLNLTRRAGHDIEHYHLKDPNNPECSYDNPENHMIAFDYFVPIKKTTLPPPNTN